MTSLIIDFDSTLVTLETLDELARISLSGNTRSEEIYAKIKELTEQGMNGEISFNQSLEKRLSLISLNQSHIEEVAYSLSRHITPSILAHQEFFKKNSKDIFIISGGFTECILPTAEILGIKAEHIFANRLIIDADGHVRGVDPENPLAHELGKVKMAKLLELTAPVHVIGDGITDYQLKLHNACDAFFAFTEIASRPAVVAVADHVLPDFGAYLKLR